jgi:23S rRNA pseudouridine2605 synthase
MRLNRWLALASDLSRRAADEAIANARVTVNGAVATLGTQVEEGDSVTLDGAELQAPTTYRTIMLHKPKGYVCSRTKQGKSPTIYDLLPDELFQLKSVGRLDKDSSGLLLLTDDGALAHQLTHPSYQKEKIYEIELDKPLALGDQRSIDAGVELGDGVSHLKLDGSGRSWQVRMHEGRNRQIRRTFARLGYKVTKLHRTDFGPYQLGDLETGKYQDIEVVS